MSQQRPEEPQGQPSSAEQDLPEQIQIRSDKRKRYLDEGLQAYPVDLRRDHTLTEVRAGWPDLQAGEETQDVVTIGGRVMFIRNSGKLCFATLQDGFTPSHDAERLQIMLSRAEIGEQALAAWKTDIDLGDFVWVRGRVIASRRGELSVLAQEWKLASKALRPLPTLHKELSEESRVRQRYNDLIVRPQARAIVRERATITSTIRRSLDEQGYLEVETPILQSQHGGAAARPFTTHLNAFDIDMYLRIALELHLKRVMVGGADRVYEVGRVFRNEGVDSSHSPEFTMLEAYQSWGDQFTIAETLKSIIMAVADAVGRHQIETEQGTIDLDGEWTWLPVHEGLSRAVGEEITPSTPLARLRQIADAHHVNYDESWIDQKLVVELFGELVEKKLLEPTFVCDFPEIAQPLARRHRSKPGCIEAWDLIIGGLERGTGFSELVDPVIQREILTEQSLAAAAGDPEAMQLDEDFLNALEQGCPPMGGLGLGIDRLIMLFTNAGIRETILFPLLRPLG